MFAFSDVEPLTGWVWGETPEDENPFLIRASRMGCEYCPDDFSIVRDEGYRHFTVHMVFSGCSFFHVAGKDYLLKKGDVFLIHAGEAHRYRNMGGEQLGYMWIEFCEDACRDLLSYFLVHRIRTLESRYTDGIARRFIELFSYVKQGEPDRFELSVRYYRLLLAMMEAAEKKPGEVWPDFMVQCLREMDDPAGARASVSEMAARLHVSHAYLTRAFRHYLGTTPCRYMTMKRVENACRLLWGTALSCEAVAEKAGFYDAAHMNRVFVKVMGEPPGTYRKAAVHLEKQGKE